MKKCLKDLKILYTCIYTTTLRKRNKKGNKITPDFKTSLTQCLQCISANYISGGALAWEKFNMFCLHMGMIKHAETAAGNLRILKPSLICLNMVKYGLSMMTPN